MTHEIDNNENNETNENSRMNRRGFIALGAGVLGVALFLSAQRFFGGPASSPGAMNVTKPKPAGK